MAASAATRRRSASSARRPRTKAPAAQHTASTGLQLGWNMAVGGIFGATVSGSADRLGSLLEATVSGPEAITGGGFGPEAGVVAILACLIPTLLFLRHAKNRGRLYARGTPRC